MLKDLKTAFKLFKLLTLPRSPLKPFLIKPAFVSLIHLNPDMVVMFDSSARTFTLSVHISEINIKDSAQIGRILLNNFNLTAGDIEPEMLYPENQVFMVSLDYKAVFAMELVRRPKQLFSFLSEVAADIKALNKFQDSLFEEEQENFERTPYLSSSFELDIFKDLFKSPPENHDQTETN